MKEKVRLHKIETFLWFSNMEIMVIDWLERLIRWFHESTKICYFFLLFFRYNFKLYLNIKRNAEITSKFVKTGFLVSVIDLMSSLYIYIYFVFRPNQTLHHISSNWWGWFRSLLMPSRQPSGWGCLWGWIPNCSWRRYFQNFHFFI